MLWRKSREGRYSSLFVPLVLGLHPIKKLLQSILAGVAIGWWRVFAGGLGALW